MAFQTKPDSGSLFPNHRKETEAHPDRSGKALIGDVWYWVSAWDKEGRSGPLLSLSFREMTAEQAAKENGVGATPPTPAAPAARVARARPQRDEFDDLPF